MRWYLGHCCLILQLSLWSGGCIGAPPASSNTLAAAAVPSNALSATTTVSTTAVSADTNIINNNIVNDNSIVASTTTLAPSPSPPLLRRSQRSVKEKDLVDYIAMEELGERPYVTSSEEEGGWPPADPRLGGGWHLEPQVGKRPKRMRGQERITTAH